MITARRSFFVRWPRPLHVLMAAIVLLRASLAADTPASAPRPEWQDETRLHEGTELPFATMSVFPDERAARAGRHGLGAARDGSPFTQSLNGDWKFHFSPRPAERVADFWSTTFDDRL